jgi:hypothetical protein
MLIYTNRLNEKLGLLRTGLVSNNTKHVYCRLVFRSPEDFRKTPLNPAPSPRQLEPNERASVSGASR